jgi:hypothetical protein
MASPVQLGPRAALPALCTNDETDDGSFHCTTISTSGMLQPYTSKNWHFQQIYMIPTTYHPCSISTNQNPYIPALNKAITVVQYFWEKAAL